MRDLQEKDNFLTTIDVNPTKLLLDRMNEESNLSEIVLLT